MCLDKFQAVAEETHTWLSEVISDLLKLYNTFIHLIIILSQKCQPSFN